MNIQWTADNVTTGSKISLCYDEDTTFSGNNEHWIEIDGITAADGAGSYTWDTTGVTPGTYYMAGYLWDGNNTFTFSHLTQSITITAAQGLTVESSAVKPQTADALTAGELAPIVAAAESRLAATLGNQVSTVLAGVSFEIDDLPGGLLGETAGNTIRIDCDARRLRVVRRSDARRRQRVHRLGRFANPNGAERQPRLQPGRSAHHRNARDGPRTGLSPR